MSDWSLIYTGYDPDTEGLREALCTLGNGYFATRGAGEEAQADGVRYPGVYIAGCYNRLKSPIGDRLIENEDLVNAPNWASIAFKIDGGEWFDPLGCELLDYRQELDMRSGLLLRSFRFRDAAGRETAILARRLVHMSEAHIAAIDWRLTPENWSGPVTIRSLIDGRVQNSGVPRYRALKGRHLSPVTTSHENGFVTLTAQTRQSRIVIALAAKHELHVEGRTQEVKHEIVRGQRFIGEQFCVDVKEGGETRLEKSVALVTSRDKAVTSPTLQAQLFVNRPDGFEAQLDSHKRSWDFIWDLFDIEIEAADSITQDEVNRALRLNSFHLLQTLSPHSLNLDVGTPARGLHGESYRGHVFWDELFVFPFFNLRMPEITRGLLKYRFHRLREAKFAAREAGFAGAMYPWQSSSTGREESQALHLNPKSGRWIPDNSRLQRHVNVAIAYNIWQYFQVTEDTEFLGFYGAEMFLEIARFLASLATYNTDSGRYDINNVMGPDEYHDAYPDSEEPGLNNNAYTNVMASWVLARAVELPSRLPADQMQRLCAKLLIEPSEFEQWDKISRLLTVCHHDEGIISQFEGYGELSEFDWELYRLKYGNIQRLDRILEAEGDTPNNYKLSKQADVLMLFYLFSAEELAEIFERMGYAFDAEAIPRNVGYYLNRTSHGSSLSRLVHSWVLSRSDRARSWTMFRQVLESDLNDEQGGTTAEGIHLGSMAGAVDLLLRCYTGMETRNNVLWLNPKLPKEIQRTRMSVRYRQRRIDLEISHEEVLVKTWPGAGAAARLGLHDVIHDLEPGEERVFSL